MPELQSGLGSTWGVAQALQAGFGSSWGVAGWVQSRGGAYDSPPAGPGVPVAPGSLAPRTQIAPATVYRQTHTLDLIDLRDDSSLPVDSLTLTLDDDSVFWALAARGPGSLFAVLTTGDQPATVEARISGLAWRFVVEDVQRPRGFASDVVTITGRSVAAAAGEPYQFQRVWIGDAPTTGAQIAAGAQAQTGLGVDWLVEDWLVPAGALSFSGTPLALLQHVAAAIGADVTAHRTDVSVSVQARYPVLPREWPCQPPDAQIPWEVVEQDSFRRADQPAYNAVLLAGQQQGAVGYVRLAGTSGADQAPMITDPLLTDEPALRQRGTAVLGGAGPQARITRTLPVLVGPGEPGVIARGALVRWVDPGEVWVGIVRSVSVDAALPLVRQTITVERHFGEAAGTPIEPLVFAGPIPDINGTVGVPLSVDLSGYWAGGVVPYAWSRRAGALPAGLTLDAGTGVVSGTPTEAGTAAGYQVRCTDTVAMQADSHAFDVVIAP